MKMQLILNVVVALLVTPGLAYCGTINGNTLFSGKKSQLTPYKTGKYKNVCGPEIPNESLVIDNNRINILAKLQTGP